LAYPEVRKKNRLGVTMRKLALLLAAALIVSAPILASSPTETFAAAKAKKAAKGSDAKGGKGGGGDPNTAFVRALSDSMATVGAPRSAEGGKGKGKDKAAKKGGGKKSAK